MVPAAKCIEKKKTPHNFHVTIILALEHWVQDQTLLESTVASPAVHKLFNAQRQIGWTRSLRGVLSQQWQNYLEHELNHNEGAPAPSHFECDQFFSGLIKIMWEQQSKFWMEFQQQLRQTQGTTQLQAGIKEYKLEVHHLYSLRETFSPTASR
jgi:hypothetical protein